MSVEKGKKVFMKRCAMCHTIEKGGENKDGPNLYGFIGKKGGQTPGFKFSDANKGVGVWTEERLDQFLEDPKKFMPGTIMIFPGLKHECQRKDLIAYMKSVK